MSIRTNKNEISSIVDEIRENISEDLAQETKSFMDLNLKEEIEEIDLILKELESWTSNTSGPQKEASLKAAYLKIMQLRTAILGQDSEILYRLYIRGDVEDIDNVKIVTIREDQLMSIVGRDRNALRLKQNLDAAITEETKDNERQAIFNMHFSNISKGLEHPSRSPKNYVVTKAVITKYNGGATDEKGNIIAKGLPNLAYQDDTTKGKSAYTLKLFNRGWIYQAFDMTTEELIKMGVDFNIATTYELFHKEYFTKNLDYDNVVGFKGGDVGLMQIKSNMASLMSKVTLVKYLKIVKTILSAEGFADKEALKKYIKENFTTEETLNDTVEKEIDINVDRIIESISFNKT